MYINDVINVIVTSHTSFSSNFLLQLSSPSFSTALLSANRVISLLCTCRTNSHSRVTFSNFCSRSASFVSVSCNLVVNMWQFAWTIFCCWARCTKLTSFSWTASCNFDTCYRERGISIACVWAVMSSYKFMIICDLIYERGLIQIFRNTYDFEIYNSLYLKNELSCLCISPLIYSYST